jgi:hypothetical protein
MARKIKVGLATKYFSNRNYIREISVEGKISSKFNFTIGYYDQYAAQIIRAGNCITLLTLDIKITEDLFWNTNYFEDISKYVFWTFNKSFLLKLVEKIHSIKLQTLSRCQELLIENPVPFGEHLEHDADEELLWCFVKNNHLKRDKSFHKMFSIDKQNRNILSEAIEKRINELQHIQLASSPIEAEVESVKKLTPFLYMLKPCNDNPEETLAFMKSKTAEAEFYFAIFSAVRKLSNGKNPYGLNGCMSAMIDFFYQYNYFKKEYRLEEIFEAYLTYSGNSIGKFKTFISEFRQDKYYKKWFAKLKALKINKLP